MNSARLLRACSKRLPLFVNSKKVVTIQPKIKFALNTSYRQFTTSRKLFSQSSFQCVNIQDTEDFKSTVLENNQPVIVDFHASWCGPCKLLGPRLEAIVSEKNGTVVLAKVDIDDNSDLAMEYGVRSVPTVISFKNGKVQDTFIGLKDDDILQDFVDKLDQ